MKPEKIKAITGFQISKFKESLTIFWMTEPAHEAREEEQRKAKGCKNQVDGRISIDGLTKSRSG